MVRREANDLARVIRDLVAASLVMPAALLACDETVGAVPFDAGAPVVDASVEASAPEAGAGDAGSDAEIVDAAPDPCGPQPYDAGPDADGSAAALDVCANLVRLPCGLPKDVVPRDGCYLTLNDCDRFCKGAYFNCHAWDDSCVDGSIPDGGPVTIDCVVCLGGPGRRPRGLDERGAAAARDEAGALLAAMAYLEAASIDAFCMLRRDLERAGAPRDLVREAARAARDEARHARVMARLAAKRGAKPARVRVRATARPTLEALARENAVEGCVNETFAALLAAWQAAHARDPEVAQAMTGIARDELRHAALSWAIARWLAPRLDDAARARVRDATARAAHDLAQRGAVTPPRAREDRLALGLPSAREQRALARSLAERLGVGARAENAA